MAQYDMPVDQLRTYCPDLAVPADLDAFWAETLAGATGHPIEPSFEPVDNGLAVIDTFDVTFRGFGGSPVKGWLHLPAHRAAALPAVVEFLGYGGGRGLPHEHVLWALAGCAHLVMDTRGQGSGWSVGDTADIDPSGAPAHPGFMTRGILDPRTYYYRRLFVDAVLAVAVVRSHPTIDPSRIAVNGGSQGGALSIAAASLSPDVAAVIAFVPFLADFPRAIALVETDPYAEVARYLKAHRDHVDQVLHTLSYFDVAILGRRASAPALFTIGLMDQITPPSTCYAAFNHYGGPKQVIEYPFNDHEGGEAFQERDAMRWLAEHLGS